MRVATCDRCGEVFNPTEHDNCVKIKTIDGSEMLGRIWRATNDPARVVIDICPQCYEGFRMWFNMEDEGDYINNHPELQKEEDQNG